LKYDYMKGKVTHLSPLFTTLEVGGIGYRVAIPVNAYTALSTANSEILLYISDIVREDSHRLFGFQTREERDRFEKLCDISGIGPKTALLLIGYLPFEEMHLAISSGDIKTISRTPGIGKKTAERLIIEMRDKIDSPIPAGSPHGDALSALINLGYNAKEASRALKKVSDNETELGALITAALKVI
jgi:holliday junction DNA helicase RuvA